MSIETRQQVAQAVRAVESKKGEDLAILEMDRTTGPFTDYFVVCTGTNPRQIQAISDEVERGLQSMGARPASIEGYNQAEWVLLDYVDFVVHIFSERARKFYDLERLWKSASRLTAADLLKKPTTTKPAKRTASARSAKAKSTAGPKAGNKRKKTPTTKKTTKRTIRKGKF
jgi:ribosome-associated protein